MGSKQLGFCDYEQSTAKKRTKKEKFRAEMDQLVPWQPLLDLIETVYPKASSKGGHPPYPLATMLRIHLNAAVIQPPPVSGKMSPPLVSTPGGLRT